MVGSTPDTGTTGPAEGDGLAKSAVAEKENWNGLRALAPSPIGDRLAVNGVENENAAPVPLMALWDEENDPDAAREAKDDAVAECAESGALPAPVALVLIS
jgi:hypothetical protein